MTPARLSLIALALSISFSTGVFAVEVATPVAPMRLATRINGEGWTSDLDAIAKRRVLRILVVPSALGFYFNGSEMQGAMFELGRPGTSPKREAQNPRFADHRGVHPGGA